MDSTQKTSQHVELNEHLIEIQTPPPEKDQFFLRDTLQPGLALRITHGSKSFIVEGWVNGRSRRVTLGKVTALSLKQARKLARQTLGKWASGVDTVEEERLRERETQARSALDAARSVTLNQVFDRYIENRNLTEKTLLDYRRIMVTDLVDWCDLPVVNITRNLVEEKHRRITERAPALANLVSRLLRSLMNYAIETLEDGQGSALIVDNPVRRLRAVKAWNPVKRRETYIHAEQLAAWFQAVLHLPNAIHKHYLLFTLLMGCRKTESAELRWADVDLQAHCVTFRDTKNHDDVTLPIADYVADFLASMKDQATTEYVFPGEHGGALVDCRKSMMKVTAESKVSFTLHDLRRTYATTAEFLDLGTYTLKLLLNHRTGRSDVTGGYVARDLQRLRQVQQRITDELLKQAIVF